MEKLPGNHDQRQVGPVTLMCMAPEARDLMLKAEEGYAAYAKATGVRQSVPELIQWLFKKSGLVDDIQELATEAFEKHRKNIRLTNYPSTKLQRSINRRSIHCFTYWFFRWSTLIDANGKATGDS